VLFAGTIGENIAYGLNGVMLAGADDVTTLEHSNVEDGSAEFQVIQCRSVTGVGTTAAQARRVWAAVVHAAKQAAAHDFICALPEGYDTDVGNQGGSLSGGEFNSLSQHATCAVCEANSLPCLYP
jgi:ABC-type multidrug transport system fused ATPase/permease subunit